MDGPERRTDLVYVNFFFDSTLQVVTEAFSVRNRLSLITLRQLFCTESDISSTLFSPSIILHFIQFILNDLTIVDMYGISKTSKEAVKHRAVRAISFQPAV